MSRDYCESATEILNLYSYKSKTLTEGVEIGAYLILH